jgi:hypothetical protein
MKNLLEKMKRRLKELDKDGIKVITWIIMK